MKKIYIKPVIDASYIETNAILAASGDFGNGGKKPSEAGSKESAVIWSDDNE